MAQKERKSMKAAIGVPAAMLNEVKAFLEARGVALEPVSGEACIARIEKAGDKKECDSATLYPGGWIACGAALKMAERLGIPAREMGALIDHLEIKVKHCSLGLF